jgi:hypothetical protein
MTNIRPIQQNGYKSLMGGQNGRHDKNGLSRAARSYVKTAKLSEIKAFPAYKKPSMVQVSKALAP